MLTGGKADPDLQKQARASKKKKKKEAYEIGEPYARHTFDVTPGQDYEQSVKSKVARNPTYKTGLKDRLLEKSIKKDTKMNGKKNFKKPIIA